MRLDITGRHVTVTPALRQLITQRLSILERVLNDAAVSALVILTKEKYRHRVEIAIHAAGDHSLSGTAEAASWVLAIRQATLKIEQQAKKLKGKWDSRKRQSAKVVRNRKAASVAPAMTDSPAADAPRVVRARYAVKPLSIDDAALQLERSDDSFVVFRHVDDDSLAIMYRRKDGNLGLIQP
ncbi:MAG: ribosome-associated translation inhibitor RaiA [Vicinamibacterales bacterium]